MRLEGRRGKRRDDKPTGLAGVMENEKKLDPVGSTVRQPSRDDEIVLGQ